MLVIINNNRICILKSACAGLIGFGMCGLFFAAGCQSFRGAGEADDFLREETAEADRVTFLGLEEKAREASLAALEAEKRGEHERATEMYRQASIYYRTLAGGARYKTCCVTFAQKKYSEALDRLLDFLKDDPDMGEFVFSRGGGCASRFYVCLYYECGKEEADGWLKEVQDVLDEKGRMWMMLLTDRTLSDSDIATAKNGLSKWQRGQIVMYRSLLSEIDAAGRVRNDNSHNPYPKLKKGRLGASSSRLPSSAPVVGAR